jgi:hypothetical protein
MLNSIEGEGTAGDAGASGGGKPAGEGAAAGASGGAPAGANGAAAPFYEAFTKEAIRTSPSVQLFKDVEALAEGYVNLEKRFGIEPNRRLDLPADPNDTAAMRAIWGKLGLPEKADGYKLTLAPEATEADKAMLASFTGRAHELGLPTAMAKGVMDFWVEQVAAAQTASHDASVAALHAGEEALKKEWGQAYEPRLREIGALVVKYGDPALAAELTADKIGNHPELAKFLGKIIERMAEPGVMGGDGGAPPPGFDGKVLSPAQASAAAQAIEANPGLRDKNHPQHKALVAERQRLLAMAEPET